jgi:hypothetical protein
MVLPEWAVLTVGECHALIITAYLHLYAPWSSWAYKHTMPQAFQVTGSITGVVVLVAIVHISNDANHACMSQLVNCLGPMCMLLRRW